MTCLTWRPDGRAIAVGHENGKILLYDVENDGEPDDFSFITTTKGENISSHSEKVVALHWINYAMDKSRKSRNEINLYEDRTKRFLSSEPLNDSLNSYSNVCSYSKDSMSGNTFKNNSFVHGDSINVLVSADRSGKVLFQISAKIPILQLNVQESDNTSGHDYSHSVEKIYLAPSFNNLVLFLSAQNTKGKIVVFNTKHLSECISELFAVGNHFFHFNNLLPKLEKSFSKMVTQWKGSIRVFEAKMGLLNPLFEKYGAEDPPQMHMYRMLAMGITSPPIAQFFSQDMQELSVNRMEKAFNSGTNTISSIAQDDVNVYLSNLIFRLGELKGLSRWKLKFEPVGLVEGCISEVLELCEDLWIMNEDFLQHLRGTMADFKILFHYFIQLIREQSGCSKSLSNNIQQLSASDKRRLASFLRKDYLHSCKENSSKTHFLKDVDRFLRPNLCKASSNSGGFNSIQAKIEEKLIDLFLGILKKNSQAVCEATKLSPLYNLVTSNPLLVNSFSILDIDYTKEPSEQYKDGRWVNFFVYAKPNILWVVRYWDTQHSQSLQWEIASIDIPNLNIIISAKFYFKNLQSNEDEEQQISILFQSRTQMPNTCYFSVFSYGDINFQDLCSFKKEDAYIPDNIKNRELTISANSNSIFDSITSNIYTCGNRGITCITNIPSSLYIFDTEEDEEPEEDVEMV